MFYSINKEKVFSKPIHAGFCVLELSKIKQKQRYYCKMLPYFGEENIVLYYMDTDSFVYLFTRTKKIQGFETF